MKKREIKYSIDNELNKKFKKTLKKNGIDKSEFIKNCINEYVRKHTVIMNIDDIMEKISKYGVDSITKAEKEFLDKQCE